MCQAIGPRDWCSHPSARPNGELRVSKRRPLTMKRGTLFLLLALLFTARLTTALLAALLTSATLPTTALLSGAPFVEGTLL